jgi:uncharacterized protein with ACT and thioredoxin-like domain
MIKNKMHISFTKRELSAISAMIAGRVESIKVEKERTLSYLKYEEDDQFCDLYISIHGKSYFKKLKSLVKKLEVEERLFKAIESKLNRVHSKECILTIGGEK